MPIEKNPNKTGTYDRYKSKYIGQLREFEVEGDVLINDLLDSIPGKENLTPHQLNGVRRILKAAGTNATAGDVREMTLHDLENADKIGAQGAMILKKLFGGK